MGRKFFIGSNWKCNGTLEEVRKLLVLSMQQKYHPKTLWNSLLALCSYFFLQFNSEERVEWKVAEYLTTKAYEELYALISMCIIGVSIPKACITVRTHRYTALKGGDCAPCVHINFLILYKSDNRGTQQYHPDLILMVGCIFQNYRITLHDAM